MRIVGLVAAAVFLTAAAPPVAFTSMEPRFASDTAEYRRIWEREGPRMAAALEAASGVEFPAAPIDALVSDGPPMMSYDGRNMRLRARYTTDYKSATLMHELGHRLSFLLPRRAGLDDHRLLYLFLYDAWTDLYGKTFADRMVGIERRIPGTYDYDAAWTWALAMTREERQARLSAMRAARSPAEPVFNPEAARR
jgi:hypothetical protein